MVLFAVIKARNRLVGIRGAVKDENFGVGLRRRLNEVEREDGAAGTLETSRPFLGPPMHLAQSVGHVSLLSGVNRVIVGLLKLAQEGLINVAALACLEAKNRGVSNEGTLAEDSFVPLDPIVDHAVLPRQVVEEAVNVVHDDHIDIQEQGGTLQLRVAVLIDGQLGKDARPLFLRIAGVRRQGDGVDPFIQTGRIIRSAHETERSMQMTFNRMVQNIGVGGGVAFSPLEAKNVDQSRLTHAYMLCRSRCPVKILLRFFVDSTPCDACASPAPGGTRLSV